MAGHVRLELRNVVSNYPFERSRGFPGSKPNSGHRDDSRLSCAVNQMQLGSSGRTNQAFLRGVGHGAASLPVCGRVRGVRSQRPAHLAVWLFASHMTMSQTSSALEHDAVATLLIIGASRGLPRSGPAIDGSTRGIPRFLMESNPRVEPKFPLLVVGISGTLRGRTSWSGKSKNCCCSPAWAGSSRASRTP